MEDSNNNAERYFREKIFQQFEADLVLADDQGMRLNQCLCVAFALLLVIIAIDYFVF